MASIIYLYISYIVSWQKKVILICILLKVSMEDARRSVGRMWEARGLWTCERFAAEEAWDSRWTKTAADLRAK